MAEPETDVLIVGGGPVGLAARALLERWGVRTVLVEKRRELSPFPRSRLVNVRSMEIFRQLGIAEEVAERAFGARYGRVRFRDTLHADDFATAAMVGIHEPIAESPVIGVVTSQDRLEPTLLAAAETPVWFGAELVDLSEQADAVVARLIDHRSGEEIRLSAHYVLAADGANSTVRRQLGIGTVGPGALLDVTTVVFDADLDQWCAEQPAGVYFTAHGSFLPLYPEGGWAWFGPTPEDVAGADWAGIVSNALGSAADTRPEVLRVQHWVMNAFVAERFHHGRILLAGDAVHAVPIVGGLGMNTGIGDVHNLCWKLAGVLHGWAGPGLLDTYEAEREPVAQQTLRRAVANTRLMVEVQSRRQERADATEAELPWSEEYFAQLGLVLGVGYRSAAVLGGDDIRREPGTGYVPTAEPGYRVPHLWLGRNRSTLDVTRERFALLTADPDGWAPHTAVSCPLTVEALPAEHLDLCGLGAHGALLVRPDGHVGARWSGPPPDRAAVPRALAALTGSLGGP
ncbi:FAD-dependent monooxygenase [Pseudonocardia spinosispora]|uniref:FAD-dependent monooxygenase n=1 Tax=Pseudonocardia spinosispora TaxID=103441 RepID=UPI0003FDBF01|nr:FAD-dependent monooxygenase [Pseudonocardia spinosispora]